MVAIKLCKLIKKIQFNELIYIFSDILIKAVAFISMPLFLNIMTVTEFGEFSYYQSISAILMIFVGLNISSSIVRYCVERNEQPKKLGTAVWIVSASIVIVFLAFIMIYTFTSIISWNFKIIITMLIFAFSSCIYMIGLEAIRATGDAKKYGLSGIFYSIASTVFGLVLVYCVESDLAFWRLFSLTLVTIFMAGIWTYELVRNDGIDFDINTARYFLKFSIPLIPYTLSTTILVQINKIFLGYISLDAVGIYSFAANLASIIYVISLASNRSLQYDIFTSIRDGKDYTKRIYVNMLVFYIFYVLIIFGTDILIMIFGNNDYYGAVKIIPILALGYGFCYIYAIYSNFLYYYKVTGVLGAFSIISAIFICLSDILFIPTFGYFGASLSMAFAYLILFLLGYCYTTFFLNLRPIKLRYLLIYLLGLILPVIIKVLM